MPKDKPHHEPLNIETPGPEPENDEVINPPKPAKKVIYDDDGYVIIDPDDYEEIDDYSKLVHTEIPSIKEYCANRKRSDKYNQLHEENTKNKK